MTTTPAPEFRIQWTGNIKVYVPVRPSWWAPHAGPDCNVFIAPHADCDCGAEITW